MQTLYDFVIIGGGHNGLTAAAYLARAGRSVIVLEKNAVAGGAAVTEEFHPGFRNSVASYTVSLLDPGVIRDLELARHGLRIIERTAAIFLPIDSERALLWPYGMEAKQAAIAEFSARDAARLSSLRRGSGAGRGGAARPHEAHAAQCWRRMDRTVEGRRYRPPLPGDRSGRPEAARRSFYPQRGGFSRSVVRERSCESSVWLRRDRRGLRRAIDAGDRICPAAPLLWRGERQERCVGTCRRWHGRHYAGDGPVRGSGWCGYPVQRAGEAACGGKWPGGRRGTGQWRHRARPCGRRQCGAETPVPRSYPGWRGCGGDARAVPGHQHRLRHLPHECRPVGTPRFHRAAGG